MVLGARERRRNRAVTEREEGHLLAVEEFLDDRLGRWEGGFRQQRIDRPLRLLDGLGDDHALSGGQTIGLHDNRRAAIANVSLRVGAASEAAVVSRRDAELAAKILGEAL